MGTHRISNRRRGARRGLLAARLPLRRCAAADRWRGHGAGRRRAYLRVRRPAEEPGFFGGIVRWFDRQAAEFRLRTSRTPARHVENFSREAGIAAKTTVEGAKDAADAVARIPTARVVTGHEKCAIAPNGAPDCLAAANTMCRAKGFASGKSVDMTTAEVCPAQGLCCPAATAAKAATPKLSVPRALPIILIPSFWVAARTRAPE